MWAQLGRLLKGLVVVGSLMSAGRASAAPSVDLEPAVALEASPPALPGTALSTCLASSGESRLVAYIQNGGLVVRLLDSKGQPRTDPVLVVEGASAADVAFDGTAFDVAWLQAGLPYLQRVAVDGALLGAPLRLGNDEHAYGALATAAGDASALLIFASTTRATTWTVDADGVHFGDTIAANGVFDGVRAGFSAGQYLAILSDFTVRAARIGADGEFLDDSLLVLDGWTRRVPAIAPASDGFVLAWTSGRSVEAAHLSFAGVLSNLPGPLVTDADHALLYPVLRKVGSGYLLAVNRYDCRTCDPPDDTAFFPLDATLTAGTPLFLSGPQGVGRQVAVTAESASIVVTLIDRKHRLWAQGIESDLSGLLGPRELIALTSAHHMSPKAAPGPDGWMAIWATRLYEDGDFVERLTGVHLDLAGQLVQPSFAVGGDSIDSMLDVSGGTLGWLMVGNGPMGPGTVFLNASGTHSNPQFLGHDMARNAQLLPAKHGWLLVWQYWDSYWGWVPMVSSFDELGTLVGSHQLAEPSATRYEMSMAAEGDAFRVVWPTDDGIVSQRLDAQANPAGERESFERLPYRPYLVSFAANEQRTWLAWAESNTGILLIRQPGTQPQASPLEQQRLSPLLAVQNLVAGTLARSDPASPQVLSIVVGDDTLRLTTAVKLSGVWESHLSAARGDQALLTYTVTTQAFGTNVAKTFARIAHIKPGPIGDGGASGQGGEGGETSAVPTGGVKSEGGEPTTDNGGASGHSGAAEPGSGAPTTPAPMANAGAPATGEPELPAGGPRTSRGCGCAIPSTSDADQSLLVALAACWSLRRRRQRHGSS